MAGASCSTTTQMKNAQAAGAVAVIVARLGSGPPFGLASGDQTLTIPGVMVSQADGNVFKANLPMNVTVASPLGVRRDSSLDAGVIAHEFAHGISTRLTGGPSTATCLNNTEQMGEGWSDFLALVVTAKAGQTALTARGMGNYLVYEDATGGGIRPTPYTTDMAVNPTTYENIKTLAIPHGVGYAWATMLWEVYWNLIGKHGFNPDIYADWTTGGNNLAIQLVMDGMKLQPCTPGFVDGRDAILQADQVLTGGANQCAIWHGFAKRGLGASADQGTTASRTDGTEAFDLPAACLSGPSISVTPTSLSATQTANTQTTATLTVANTGGADFPGLTWTIAEGASGCASSADLPWVSVDPIASTTSQGASSNVAVTFDSTGLPVGVVGGTLCVGSNDSANSVVAVPVSLSVTYTFTGFLPPVANAPAVNEVRAGSVVPVMWRLAGNQGLAVLESGFPASQQVDCSTLSAIGPSQPTVPPAKVALKYEAMLNRYLYPWATTAGWRGQCRQLNVRLNDGTDHIAVFAFR
jgi:hypothetical protein